MKRMLPFLLILLFSVQFAQAQFKRPFKIFKVDIAAGRSGDDHTVLSIEPSLNYLGFKLGWRAETLSTDMKSINSQLYTLDKYIINDAAVRPFIGVGLGKYFVTERGGCSAGIGGITLHDTNPNGRLLRGGVETGHLRVSFEYNFIHATQVSGYDEYGKLTGVNIYHNNYFSAKLALVIGGGRRYSKKTAD